MTKYNMLRNKETRDINNQKKKYYEGHSKICENQGNAKGMWKALNGILNRKGHTRNI